MEEDDDPPYDVGLDGVEVESFLELLPVAVEEAATAILVGDELLLVMVLLGDPPLTISRTLMTCICTGLSSRGLSTMVGAGAAFLAATSGVPGAASSAFLLVRVRLRFGADDDSPPSIDSLSSAIFSAISARNG